MTKTGKLYLAGLFFVALSIVMLGVTVPVYAHDGTVASESSPYVFNDTTPYDVYHADATPYKGFFMLWTQNSTGTAWSGFNFSVSGSNAVFIDTSLYGDCSWAYDGDCDPRSSKGVNSWNISGDQKSMSVSLSNTWNSGQTGWIRVYTDNTASPQGDFTVSVSPVLVPEPISSTLFIAGAATLGFRRFRNKA